MNSILSLARACIWVVGLSIISSCVFAFVGIPLHFLFWIGVCLIIFAAWYNRAIRVPLLLFIALIAVCIIPALLRQDGLPTGDSQKAIIWAREIDRTGRLPDYHSALFRLNRDPVDFYTPGLHAALALATSFDGVDSPFPLIQVSLISVVSGIAVAFIASGMTVLLVHDRAFSVSAVFFTFVFLLTNIRFLRYLREPGYHFQNLIGELLLFGLLFALLSLLVQWNKKNALLALIAGVALPISHQFSSFIAAFVLVPIIAVFLMMKRKIFFAYLRSNIILGASSAFIFLLLIGSGFLLGLHEKIPHIFSTDVHLLSLVPSFNDYFGHFGTIVPALALVGLGVMVHSRQPIGFAFAGVILVLIILSQGPRFFIDIPPVRALFYAVVPLSIFAAIGAAWLLHAAAYRYRSVERVVLLGLLLTVIGFSGTRSVMKAYALSDPAIRTNSTLQAEQLWLTQYIGESAKHLDEAILIDDYNQRSASWLVLSGQRLFTRIASDLERQMDESSQSQLRRTLYLNQLDYEKIFALGSHPSSSALFEKHGIRWITGVVGKSDIAFAANRSLHEVSQGNNLVLYEHISTPDADGVSLLNTWLLRASTLVNDIGDKEDTFEHLQASVRAPRLSDPLRQGDVTFRTTTASYIPLRYNVGDYVRVLWDQDADAVADGSLQFHVDMIHRISDLSLLLPDGTHVDIPPDGTVQIAAHSVPIDEKGFITIVLYNPNESEVSLDLIALGFGQTP